MIQTALDFTHPATPYWPTVPQSPETTAAAVACAEQQDAAVMAILARLRCASPSQVHAAGLAAGRAWLLTSVRRSMTNLAKAGALVKTDDTRMGPHGRLETLWRLPR